MVQPLAAEDLLVVLAEDLLVVLAEGLVVLVLVLHEAYSQQNQSLRFRLN